jgi:hypothetical protein
MGTLFDIAPDWRARGMATLKVILFIGIFVALNLALNEALAGVQSHIKTVEGHMLLSMGSLLVAAIALTAAMAWPSGRRFAEFGLGGATRAANFGFGILCGLIALCAQLGTLALLRDLSWTTSVFDSALLWEAVMLTAFFLVVALTEEVLFRGYILVELARAVSFWPATLGLALLFGSMHWLKGGGENFYGGLDAFGAALVFALSFRMTGSLWIAIGIHFGWDFAQSFVFGVPDSAVVFSHSLVKASLHGSQIWTGGSVGPEGSPLALILLPLVIVLSWIRRIR